MDEQEFIQKIKSLKQITPDDGWIALTKSQILNEYQPSQEKQERVSIISILKFTLLNPAKQGFRLLKRNHLTGLTFRPMTLAPIALSFAIGLFLLGQISLPGEPLHSVKKIAETTHETIVKQENKSAFYLDLAGKRANELKEVVSTHQTKKLSPAIKEYQASLKKATESMVEAMAEQEPEQAVVIVQKVAELKQITKEIEQDLDIEMEEIGELEETTLACLRQGFETIDNEMAVIVAQQIQELENSSLDEEQEKVLEEIKVLYENKDYKGALIKILFLSQ